ncbi:MAG: hypothetical protein QOE96_3794 [Blastocatellia bacterium]|jgi:hypothetical protein|nr:hypothetical protein [Blastocatellia bacterium]
MAETPKRYKPSQEQIDQLCRSRNESEAEARAFLESDSRDAKDMLAYLEYEGRQIPPDDLPEWVDKSDTIHLSLEDEGVAEASDAPPEEEDEPPFDSRARQHPITPQVRKKIEDQGKWGDDWPQRGEGQRPPTAEPDWTQTRKRGKRSITPRFATICESDFSDPSIAEKFWKLTDSNLFWGGGIGVALAAYAFELGGAPRFSVFLLVAAWLVITISIFRHGFFARSSKTAKRIYESLISLIIAAALVITWILLYPITIQPAQVSVGSSPTPLSAMTPTQLQAVPSVSQSPKPSPVSSLSQTPTVAKQESSVAPVPSDAKIGLLQCIVSEYDNGYKLFGGATCVAKHQQTGQEFIGTTDKDGTANINVPYGFYVVTIKATGYGTRVEAAKVGDTVGSVSVVLEKAR